MAVVIGGTSFTEQDIFALLQRDVSKDGENLSGEEVFARILSGSVGGKLATIQTRAAEDYRQFKENALVPPYAVQAVEAIMCAGK
ncbi:MAG: hypothetical protein Q7S26_00625 [bacterium]|nr:hypothetical protein [bacterium]